MNQKIFIRFYFIYFKYIYTSIIININNISRILNEIVHIFKYN